MPGRPQPIARQLTRTHIAATGAALFLAGTALIVYDFISFREVIARNLSIQAQIIGSTSVSAIVFDDPASVEESLSALNVSPNVVAAGVFAPDGRPFAVYTREPGAAVSPPALPGARDQAQWVDGLRVELVQRIALDGKPVGTVYIRAQLQELAARFKRYALIVAGVSFASLVAAFFVSRASRRTISRPIVELARLAGQISEERDYSVRAPAVGSAHELTVLVEAFNDMLAHIQARDLELQDGRDQLEARVRQRTAELDGVNKELEAFSYSVSHDLRAPLRHVTGFADLLEQRAGPQLDSVSRRYLKTITDASTRMGRLIDDLLAFSRMGRTAVTRSRVSLATLVNEARAEVSAEAAGRDIVWTVSPALPDIEADPALLRQVLVNLFSNAVKYSATRPRAEIEVGALEQADGMIVLFVRDNGVGFDMQYAHKLFGVFQRLHRSDEFEGTGIGLANVRRIVQRHGGRVWAESEVDRGATFYVSLPVKGQDT